MFIMAIMAAVKAPKMFENGQPYRYPVRFEIIK